MAKIEINRIIDLLEQLHTNTNWVETDLYGILDGITDETANLQLPHFNHTIHQLARHLVTDVVVVKRLQGIHYEIPTEEYWVPLDQMHFTWADTVKAIKKNKQQLIKEMQKLSDEDLDKPILPGLSSVYRNLHGYIQHTYYHFAQIVVMVKYIENSRPY